MAYTIVLDPGHGGSDPGATYGGRQEKDDSLRLTMAVGKILTDNGFNVVYTRTTDVYNTPFEKATIGNNNNADLFVSIHRNSAPASNMYNGIQTLVFNDSGLKAQLARNINSNLENLGFDNKGVVERPNLVVLKRTKSPAVLVEAGFINSDKDNAIYDSQFNDVAKAIADGIMETLDTNMRKYSVQVGAYRNRYLAENQANRLKTYGFPATVVFEKGLFKVRVGNSTNIDEITRLQQQLRELGLDTFIVG